jgi:hypothetical protein
MRTTRLEKERKRIQVEVTSYNHNSPHIKGKKILREKEEQSESEKKWIQRLPR